MKDEDLTRTPAVCPNADKLPGPVRSHLLETLSRVDSKIRSAEALMTCPIHGKVGMRYVQMVPKNILSQYEQAQSLCFVIRYENLPSLELLEIRKVHGEYRLANLAFLRHLLNEYRSIVLNRRDSIYYNSVHRSCRAKLTCSPGNGLTLRVRQEGTGDITAAFLKSLDESHKAIKQIIDASEFGYVYNGILQHSDHIYTDRFWEEYASGALNHILIEHAALLGYIKHCLRWHYTILHNLTFPVAGPL